MDAAELIPITVGRIGGGLDIPEFCGLARYAMDAMSGQIMRAPSKSESHGRIGESAVCAKCWMHGIPAYSTGGLRSNFAGSDLIVETADPRRKCWVQVKTGAPTAKGQVYLTQSAGDTDLVKDKFAADFVVFVNVDPRTAKWHAHDGSLDFANLSFYVVPATHANAMVRHALEIQAATPRRDGRRRSLTNVAIHVPMDQMSQYRDAWALLKAASATAI